jgi:hypothetical protein
MPTPQEILAQYERLVLHEANEAETRLKVINDVLYSVLGWTHADVRVEERVSEDGSTTWADYTIRTGMTALVVEVKKVGVAFSEVPDVRRAQLNRRLVSGTTGDTFRITKGALSTPTKMRSRLFSKDPSICSPMTKANENDASHNS